MTTEADVDVMIQLINAKLASNGGNSLFSRLLLRSEWQVTDRSAEIGDCFVWTGHRAASGHGQIWHVGRVTTVQRAVWTESRGVLTEEKPHVLHRCDNPPCWRLDHLFVGTQADNNLDMTAKGRHGMSAKTHCPRNHPYSEENTYINPQGGGRVCRICKKAGRTR